MTPEQRALQVRWDTLLSKIRERVEEILTEAHSGCLAVFVQGNHDPFTMGNVLPAVRSRILDLGAKIEDSWSEKVMDAFFATGLSWDTGMTAEHAKIAHMREWMEAEYEAFEIRVKADASRMLAGLLEKKIPDRLRCTQCGSPIPVPRAFVAVNVPCGSCRSVNTFEPGELRILHAFAIPCLAHESAWEAHHDKPVMPKPAYLVATDTYVEEAARWRDRLEIR